MSNADLDFSYTQNRELSWLRFNDRVLEEASAPETPLFERLKFVSIFTSNLDEFFMIRVGGLQEVSRLKKEPVDNKSNQTPTEQIAAILSALHPSIRDHAKAFERVEKDLQGYGLHRVTWRTLSDADREFVQNYYEAYVQPIISPGIIDPRHPFPNLRNLKLYAVYSLDSAQEKNILGLIDIPDSLPRVVQLPHDQKAKKTAGYRYILMEDILLACADDAFGSSFHVNRKTIMRLTRNADIDPDDVFDDDDDDYRSHMKKVLKKRLRLAPVRLELQDNFDPDLIKMMRKLLILDEDRVFVAKCPLDLGYVFGLEDHLPAFSKRELTYPAFSPQPSPDVIPGHAIYEQVMAHDIMLFYPYETMDPFVELIHEAAYDPSVISIKITLYRIAKQSRLAEFLIAAAENGKEVTVLMELRARFDEQNNIDWAGRMEEAGCIVYYGEDRFKVHSKICQITRRMDGRIQRITQLGTGNYNEKTAKQYSDLSLMTADPGIGEDANAFFRNMSLSNLAGEYRYLGVAPHSLKPLIMRGIDREIERARAGEEGRCVFKMNSLTDRELIDKLAEASQAGVQIDLIVRGIACLLPGIPGKTDNIRIRSIVGRFLEHARIYSFGDGDMVYLASADLMTRNTERRVEIAFPVFDERLRKRIRFVLDTQLEDNVKARVVGSDGMLHRVEVMPSDALVDSQATFMQVASQRAAAAGLMTNVSYHTRIESRPMVKAEAAERLADVFGDGTTDSARGRMRAADETSVADETRAGDVVAADAGAGVAGSAESAAQNTAQRAAQDAALGMAVAQSVAEGGEAAGISTDTQAVDVREEDLQLKDPSRQDALLQDSGGAAGSNQVEPEQQQGATSPSTQATSASTRREADAGNTNASSRLTQSMHMFAQAFKVLFGGGTR
ncbi:MAG: polyphosphate kinase 1 [Actinomycetaceae bacterium]|nr:polyphosphate kinase 1 [Actinomycetaceae bacterium]MDY6082620.1 polyphosphate kinase 1 [Actinomycetaceae bacterium]